MEKRVTISELLKQINEYTEVDMAIMLTAKKSNLTTYNNDDLRIINMMWKEGWYDTDPQNVIPQIKSILKMK
jgi:hypothetical protein